MSVPATGSATDNARQGRSQIVGRLNTFKYKCRQGRSEQEQEQAERSRNRQSGAADKMRQGHEGH